MAALTLVCTVLFCLGVIGCLAMTWAFPLLGRAGVYFSRRSAQQAESITTFMSGRHMVDRNGALRIAILIPAYNEERALSATLEHIAAASHVLNRSHPEVTIDLRVGADGCSDNTAQFARMLGAEVFEFPTRHGKWQTLKALVNASADADWVVLADAGTLWPADFLERISEYFGDRTIIGLAPSYVASTGSVFTRILWKFEAHLKSLENASGGPVSVHGATVLYRRQELMRALQELDTISTRCIKAQGASTEVHWLNDDVVIPLTLRTLFPDSRIRYLEDVKVMDAEHSGFSSEAKGASTFQRRRRMVIGNSQWITLLLPWVARERPATAIIAMRRLARVFWAYWVSCIGLSVFLLLMSMNPALGALICVCLVVLMMRHATFIDRLRNQYTEAFSASVISPMYFFKQRMLADGGVWR